MKSISTLLFLFSSLLVFSQSLTLNMDTIKIGLDEYIDYGTVTITNNSSQEIEIGLTLSPECYISNDDTQIQICIGLSCFGAVKQTTTWGEPTQAFLTIPAGETSGEFKFTPTVPTGDYGSEWICSFFDLNDTREKADLYVKLGGECKSVSTSDLNEELGLAYPNPAWDKIIIPVTASTDKVVITNSYGKRLATHRSQNSESININLTQLNTGLYFYQCIDVYGHTLGTAAFIKK